jgi:hypothetical protein
MHEGYFVTLFLTDQEKEDTKNARLLGVLAIGLLALWGGLVLFAFFDEHPLSTDFFLRLIGNFSIPLEVVPAKLLLAAKHIALAVLLTGTGVLAGRLLLRLFGLPAAGDSARRWDILERLMLALGLGWGLFMYATFFLGALGALYPQAVWLLMLAVLVVGFHDAGRLSQELRLLFARDKSHKPHVIFRFGLAAFWLVALSLLIIALAPSITHDAMVYHLNVPRLYANSHKIIPIPYNLFSNTVLNMEMLYTLALSIDDFMLANLLHFLTGLAALALLYSFARKMFGPVIALLAVFILFFNPLVLNEISLAYVDLVMMFYFLLMMVCLWNRHAEGNSRWFALFCVFAGIFAGIKYTALHGLLATGVVTVVAELRSRKRNIRGLLVKVLVFGGVVSIMVLPYLVKNYLMTGNPVYPLMYNLFGGKWLSLHQVERMLAYVNSHGMGHDWKHLIALPWNLTVLGNSGFNHFDAVITPLWLVFVPAFLLMRHKPPVLKWALFVCAVYFVSWAASTHITRYLLPIFPLLSLLCAYVIVALKEKVSALSSTGGRAFAGVAAAVCVFIWFTFSFFYPLRAPSEFGAVVWGTQSRDEFLAKMVPAYAAFKYINDNLPQDAYFAFFWDNRGFFCDRKQIGDSVFEAPSMLEIAHEAGSARAFHKKLRSMGIGYILFNDLFFSKFPPFTTSPEDKLSLAKDLNILKEFRDGYCRPFFSADGTTLYSVHF